MKRRKVRFMRSVFVIAAISAALMSLAASETTPRKVRPRGIAKPSGGIVERAYQGKVLRIYNVQSTVSADVVGKTVLDARLSAQLPIEVVPQDKTEDVATIATASKLANVENVGAALVMTDAPDLPFIISSPDSRWAILNVAKIGGGEEKVESRFRKLLWNGIAHALGAGSTGEKGCVLQGFSTVNDLDGIIASDPSPMAHNTMIEVAKSHGIGMISFASYRTACKQGWAPTPTNDVQKAIWDEVHAIPATPMKIEFDPKKGR